MWEADRFHLAHPTGAGHAGHHQPRRPESTIELFGPSSSQVQSQNFVLCPGKAYDRSPCGTGTSAKLACLFADGKLKAGEVWKQESIVGSIFEGSVCVVNGDILPTIKGSAFVNAEATLILNPADPFCWGSSEL